MSDLDTRVETILTRIRERLAADKDESNLSVQQEGLAGRLINVLPYLQHLKNASVNVGQAEIAVEALLRSQPQLGLAGSIVEDLERRRDIYRSVLKSVLAGRSPVAQMLLGVASHVLVLGIALPILTLVISDISWLWVAIGGAVGGITSLLVRLHDFAVVARWSPEADPKVLFFTGFLKPAVGLVFALFVWAAVYSEIVDINVVQFIDSPLAAAALAFVAGFSERFAPDLANRAAGSTGARSSD